MGSWNDIRFSDPLRQENYDTVTARLFSAVVDAIQEAVNAFGTAAEYAINPPDKCPLLSMTVPGSCLT